MAENRVQTLIIDNFQGRLTRFINGNINSGFAKYSTTFGNNPFEKPGNLTWFEEPTRIDPDSNVITDLIVASRPRLESGITYVYAVGSTGRLYKIQVNNPSTYNPNYDNPVLLTTLVADTPTFKYGSSIQFYGSTQQIYVGHDKGVTRVNFDGTGEASVGVSATWAQNVPRAAVNFTGVLYYTNGTNLASVDETATVTSYAVLNPAFPVGTQARDIDVSSDGNYVQIVVSRIGAPDMTSSVQDTTSLSSSDSYFIYWTGTSPSYTAYNPFNSYSIATNTAFGAYGYLLGYDLGGAALYDTAQGAQKILSLPFSNVPNFGAVFSVANMVGWGAPEYNPSTGQLDTSLLVYGQYDSEIPPGLFRLLRYAADAGVDSRYMPTCIIVSDLLYGASDSGYNGNIVGAAKLYFSSLENDDPFLYTFTTVPVGQGNSLNGTYETQTQLFSKKVAIREVRVYGEPWVTNNSFSIELIGSNGNAIAGASKTFTVGTNLTAGADFAWYTPQSAPTYAIGVRINNLGTMNHTITKIEIDYGSAGK